jgi:GNAT superfamily N-acetyltransferase
VNSVRAVEQHGVSFRRYDATEARQLSETVEAVYRKSYIDAVAGGRRSWNSVEAFMRRFEHYSSRPDLDLVIAYHDREPIGQTWGWPLRKDDRWWNGLKSEPFAEFAREDGQRTFALSEIMVSHKWTSKGIAHALHDILLSARRERRATLLVRPDNPARQAYERWGWTKVAQLRPGLDDAPLFDVMILDLSGHPRS